ncbi:nuclear pore complex protein Nup98-Nup96 isoform X2 [Planococcus citri]|uniref:nuclear pore complex protein Nup98-Nup96 isoform X2 n=1 Tax=Planococcus citri TaxID=170843 RepID=UPI0031F7F654
MFGSGFGNRTTSAFGQTTFGRPTTSFAQPGFGTTNTSLFGGQTSQASTSLFGNTAPTQSFGGGFASGTGGSLFGAQQPTTGTGGGLFGSQNTTMNTTGGGLFGSSGTTAFGSNTSGLGAFGATSNTGLFGQTQQPATQSTSLFGQPSTGSTGLFGSTTSAFAPGATAATGTTIKFIPVTGTDTMQRNGQTSTISTKHYCITCMKEYEGKSLEELRYEDYLANRKGPTQGVQTGSTLFGGSGQSTLFGGATSTPSTAGGGLFGSNGPSFGQTSVFGQSSGLQTNNSLFGKPASTAPFGATTTTQSTGFGTFGQQQQQTTLFGANTNQAKPAFGVSQPSTGLFGSTAPASTAFGAQNTGFGGFNTQQPQPTQGIGLFGQSQNKFGGGFGAQTTSSFTFGQATATNSTSLFGQKPATTGFGMASTTSTSTFGSATPFGAAPAAGGGLFSGGFNKPQATGFSFGSNTAAAPTLGGTNLNGGSLFGSTAAKPTGLFGSAAPSTGLFGSTNFGTGTGGGFGTSSNTGFGGLNFSSTGLGNLGGAQPTAASSNVTDQIQLLTVLPYGDSPLYKHLRPATGKTEDLLKPSVVPQKPNADSSSYKVSTQINNIVARKAHTATALEPAKKSLFDKDYEDVNKVLSQQKSSPRYLKLKPKSMLNKGKLSSDTTTDQTSLSVDNTNKENLGAGNSTYTVDTPYSPPTNMSSFIDNTSLPTSPALSKSTQISVEIHTPPSTYSDNTMAELRSQTKSSETKKNVSFVSDTQDASYQSYNATSSFISEKSEGEEEDNAIEIGNDSEKEHACGITLRRADYFTVPSLADLDEMTDDDGKCKLKHFTIGRHNFGNVTFYDSFDVAGLDLDTIVFFRHKEVEIYPNDDKKPPVGVGLNRRAQVTLDRVWPQDKASRQVIKDPERLKQLKFVDKLKRSSEKMNAQFIEYRPPTGSWVFEVEHFSKYGLDDSDEDTPQNIDDKTKKLIPPRPFSKTTADLKKIFNDKQEYNLGKKRGLDGKIIASDGDAAMDQFIYDENDEMMDDDHLTPLSKHHDYEREFYENELHSPIEKLARDLDTSLHKVQLMKASFYVDENAPLDPEISLEKGIPDLDLFATGRIDAYRSTLATKNFPSLLKTQFTSQFPPPVEIPFTDFADEEYKPPLYSPEIKPVPAVPHVVLRPQRVQVKYRNGVIPLEQSVFRNASKCLCDVGVYFGQHFRVGWGKGLTLATQSSICTANTVIDGEVDYECRIISGRKDSDYTPSVIHKLEMSTYSSSDNMKEITENHLDVCLRESVFNFEDGCPILTPKLGTDALHAHCDIEQRISRIDEDYNRQVWELMVALWGNIPDIEMEYDPKSHKNKMLRKSAVSDWLKNVVSSVAENELNESDPVASVVSLLSAGKIYEAAKTAMNNDDYNLALLISQIGSSEHTRSLMEQQLKQWHESEADQLIDDGRLKIMALVAGHMLFVSSKHIVNTCENLDWKRAFALHLWYITGSADSLVEALNQYELAFKSDGKFANAPDPPYAKDTLEYETSDGRKAFDLCYHLLKLYSRRSYALETLLNPITHTANVLDYRLSWLIMITLKNLGFTHLSEESEFILSTSFAAQLEAQNLWQWAVFVLLHIKDLNCRINRVTDTIGRNVRLLEDRSIGLTAEEQFVSEKLEVPVEWVYYAKAILASSQNRYREAAWYYVKAERWNEAHEIIMNNLVTNAIINESYAVVQDLLDEIVASERAISGWNHKGGIIYDYLTIMNEINALMAEQSIETALVMEKLQPTMSSVCHKIKFFPTNTIKERLCQAEISKRMIQFIRTILNLQYGKAGPSVRFFVSLVDQLPLPEDYRMQELNEIISWWMSK